METVALLAHPRSLQLKPKHLRLKGRIPAVCYGKGRENIHVEMDYIPFVKAFKKAGENTIIDLSVGEGKQFPVLVHDLTFDPVTDEVAHVDFVFVDMAKEVTTSVKVHFVGVSLAVKDLGGILTTQKPEIRIRCLPKDLIHSIEVDISPIVDFRTSVHVKDLKVPGTIKVLDDQEAVVVTATPPKVEEEVAKPAEAVAVEGAAPAEGATPAGAAPVAGAEAGEKKEKKADKK